MLQSLSYVAAAVGVCVAAFYYVSMIRNAEREKRRQTILMKLPPMSKEYYDAYWEIRNMYFKTPEEYYEKYSNPQTTSKIFYIMNTYNILGILWREGYMSLEDIIENYTPFAVIIIYETFWFMIPRNRFNHLGKTTHAEFWKPLELLYREMRRRFPDVSEPARSIEENLERRRLWFENNRLRVSPQ